MPGCCDRPNSRGAPATVVDDIADQFNSAPFVPLNQTTVAVAGGSLGYAAADVPRLIAEIERLRNRVD